MMHWLHETYRLKTIGTYMHVQTSAMIQGKRCTLSTIGAFSCTFKDNNCSCNV